MDLLTANDQQGVYPKGSYYTATADPGPVAPTATGEISCDVCVVGGGFTGLSSALHLAEKGYDVVLLEAHRAGWGASGRNGGQVGSGQRSDQDELEKSLGETRAHALWDIALASTNLVRSLIEKHDIKCGYTPGIIYADHRQRFVRHSHEYAEKLNTKYGYHQITPLDKTQIRHLVGSKSYFGGALDMGSGHLHPLNYALGLANAAQRAGVRIFENSKVTSITEGTRARITTESASVAADFIVMGCNGYLGTLNTHVARRVMPINNFIIATEPLSEATAQNLLRENHAVADSRFVVNYFRLSQDRRMLFGGSESYGYRFPKDIARAVRKPMLEIYPQLEETRIDYAWGGTLGITMSRMPHFRRIGKNIFNASGFSGHGVAMATMAGQIMAEAIAGQAEKFETMAAVPTPRFPGGITLRWPLLVLAMTWYSLLDRL